jgi:2-polyprenyl-3-methyl-5-hydroxy-6-metoxy-1,4-benzoquinol methylase
VFGIPDFRLFPDPYISFEDEYRKADLLAEAARQYSFEDLVRFYWEITPDVPQQAAERYIRYATNGIERGEAFLVEIDAQVRAMWRGSTCLDIGCGTGGYLAAAQDRFNTVIGVDIALRWLVIAKKRLEDTNGENISLICCSAEHLPFPDETFDRVVGLHVLEHAKNQQAILSETTRTLNRAGLCFFSTPNRFSLGPEPCVRVWGVGFLPRFLATGYVQLVKGIPYKHICLLSWFELQRLLIRSGLREWSIAPQHISESDQSSVTNFARKLIKIYNMVHRVPIISFLLRLCGPFLQVVGRK